MMQHLDLAPDQAKPGQPLELLGYSKLVVSLRGLQPALGVEEFHTPETKFSL